MTRKNEESACAATSPGLALAANLPNEALVDRHRVPRPIKEGSSKLPEAREACLGEFNALLGSAPRAGSVPVRGSAGVFGTKNQW